MAIVEKAFKDIKSYYCKNKHEEESNQENIKNIRHYSDKSTN